MSNYTVSIEEIVNSIWYEDHEHEDPLKLSSFKTALNETDEKILNAIPYIFNFEYDYYGDELDKRDLEKSILSDYYYREICCDSVAKWQRLLRNRLHDIMPKYRQMFDSQMKLIASDYLKPYLIEETFTEATENNRNRTNSLQDIRQDTSVVNNENTSTTANEGSENSEDYTQSKYSDTPQALMETGKDYLTNLTEENGTNETSFENTSTTSATSENTSTLNGERNTTGNESEDENKNRNYTKLIKGNLGKINNADLIKAYQNAIMNIEEAIIGELRDLFFQLY